MQVSVRFVTTAPRQHLFTRPRLLARSVTNTGRRQASKSSSAPAGAFGQFAGPAPPRLPKEEQELFETLQRQSTGAFSTPREAPKINQSPDALAAERSEADEEASNRAERVSDSAASRLTEDFQKVIEARGKGEELHPNVRRGAQPEFEGDTNPKTGEVGGPKNEPLRWGAAGEWSYNGRTTDF